MIPSLDTAPLRLPSRLVRVGFSALEALRLPEYPGSAWRGALARAFRSRVCTEGPIPCPACTRLGECAYPRVFETMPPPGSERLSRNADLPRPYVLRPWAGRERGVAAGGELGFDLVLLGRAIEELPRFEEAFAELATAGLTRRRAPLRLLGLEEVEDACGLDPDAREALPDPRRLRIEFLTPARIVRGGAVAGEPGFEDLARAGLRRLSALCCFHDGRPVDLDWPGLVAAAGAVRTVRAELRPAPWRRWSSRQGRSMAMDGVLGVLEVEGGLGPFLTMLAMLERAHVGKGAVFGLGRMRVEIVS